MDNTLQNYKNKLNQTKDAISLDRIQINMVKYELLSEYSVNNNYDYANPNKYSTSFVVQQAKNFINSSRYKGEINSGALQKGDVTSLIDSLNGFQSQLNTDNGDAKKVSNHLATAYHMNNKSTSDLKNMAHTMRFSGISNIKTSPIKVKPYNPAEVKDDYNDINITDPSTSNKMANGVLKYSFYYQSVNEFIKKFQHKHKGYTPTKDGNQTFYFPGNLNWERAGILKYLHDCKQNSDHYELLTNNLYHTLWNRTYSNELNADTALAKKGVNLNDTNNHPTDHSIPIGRTMANANNKYRYNLQKDLIWEQYYQNKLDYMGRYNNNLSKDHSNGLNKVKRYCTKYKAIKGTTFIGLSYKYHIPWQQIAAANPGLPPRRIPIGHMINIPIKKYSKRLGFIDNMQSAYSKGGKYWNMYLKLRNKWKNKADQVKKSMPNQQELQSEAYLQATELNIAQDSRNGRFGYIRPDNPNTDDSFVYFMVTDISPNHSTSVSSNPIEWGRNITTGTQKQPISVSITGYLFNNNFPKSYQDGTDSIDESDLQPVVDDAKAISDWNDAGAPMFFDNGLIQYPICNITDWEPDFNTGSDGSLTSCQFTMTLQPTDYFKSNDDGNTPHSKGRSRDRGTKPRNRGKASSKRNRHGFYRAKSGDTFWGIARRKGISVSSIEKANKGTSPTDIRIGQKIAIPSK